MGALCAQVVFADGTFVDGSTSELSCDGPLREPFIVFCQVRVVRIIEKLTCGLVDRTEVKLLDGTQGGTHWTHWALALESVLVSLRKAKAEQPDLVTT